jgi:hypothetical protein
VLCVAALNFQVLGAVVGFVAVDVVDKFAGRESPPDLLFGNKAVLVGVSAHVRKMVACADFDDNVAV